MVCAKLFFETGFDSMEGEAMQFNEVSTVAAPANVCAYYHRKLFRDIVRCVMQRRLGEPVFSL